MRIVVPEPKIEIGSDDFTTERDGLPLDLIGRQEFGERLSNLVDRIEDPAVIALDGDWGTGKSVFLKLWAGAHTKQFNKKGMVIYYDAFADDWRDDPLGGLIMALENAFPKSREIKYLKEIGFFLIRTVAKAAAASLMPGLSEVAKGGAEAFKAAAENIEEVAVSYFSAEEGRRGKLKEFRATLREIAQEARSDNESGAGLIFIIDELDRCKPDFALSLLEIVKHLFDVDGVVFILGTNMLNLGRIVSVKYGQGIEGQRYLDKFINLKISLPRVCKREKRGFFGGAVGENISVQIHYLYKIINKMGIFSNNDKCMKNKAITEAFLHLFGDKISLRDVDRFLEKVAVFGDSRDIIDFFIMCVIFFSGTIDIEIYNKIIHEKSVSTEGVRNFLFQMGIDRNSRYYNLLYGIYLYLCGDISNENVRKYVLEKTEYLEPRHINQEKIIYNYFDISHI